MDKWTNNQDDTLSTQTNGPPGQMEKIHNDAQNADDKTTTLK